MARLCTIHWLGLRLKLVTLRSPRARWSGDFTKAYPFWRDTNLTNLHIYRRQFWATCTVIRYVAPATWRKIRPNWSTFNSESSWRQLQWNLPTLGPINPCRIMSFETCWCKFFHPEVAPSDAPAKIGGVGVFFPPLWDCTRFVSNLFVVFAWL